MKNKQRKNVVVTWFDAALYGVAQDSSQIRPTFMKTVGEMIEETDEFIILQNTQTSVVEDTEKEKEEYKFTYIPKDMIEEIKDEKEL